MEMPGIHRSVLLKEILEYLDPKPGQRFIDATLDGGGHTFAIAAKIAPDGKVLGIEWDSELLKQLEPSLKASRFKNIIAVNDSYVNIENIVREYDFRPNGILFDLGLSSWHYEQSGRGFSFRKDELLDMRFNPSQAQTAADIVNTSSQSAIEEILKNYGEEQFAAQIAKQIVLARKTKPILTTSELVSAIAKAVPGWYTRKKIHFATKTFQALRVAVNRELENVEKGIRAAFKALASKGRLAVISFQGLEDKIVREFFKEKVKQGEAVFIVKGTLRPSWEEQKANPRSRSAKMKVIEKI